MIDECSRKRRQQFEQQASHEKILSSLPCESTVISYFIKQRILNRERTNEVFNASFITYFGEVKKVLDEIDNDFNKLESCIKNAGENKHDVCKCFE